MSFFQTTVTKKYANTFDKEVLKKAYATFKAHFHNAGIQENIRNSKEEQYQEGFFRDSFVNVLGYKLNPELDRVAAAVNLSGLFKPNVSFFLV